MALQKLMVADIGVECPEAYIVINGMQWFKGTMRCNINALVYKDKAARDEGKPHFAGFNTEFELAMGEEAEPIHVQAYNALKLLPELADAINV